MSSGPELRGRLPCQSPAASPGSGTRCRRPAPADPPPSPCLHRPTARRAPPSPGSSRPRPGAAAVVGQGGCRRVGLGKRHGSGDTRRARRGREKLGVRELNCPTAASHMRRKKEPEPAQAPALPAGSPPSCQARPALPPPSQRGTRTSPRTPAIPTAPPEEKATPLPRPGAPLQYELRTGRMGAGLRACFTLNAPPTSPFSGFSNWRGGEVRASASDYNSRQRSGQSGVFR